MSGPRARRPSGGASAGFTLIEIVCALAIVALVAALPAGLADPHVAPAWKPMRSRPPSLLIADRAAAMRRDVRRCYTQLDAKVAHTIASGSEASVAHSPEVDFWTRCSRAEIARAAALERAIVFLPNGMSCGGVIFIGRQNQAFEVRVNWLTGAVDVAPAERQPAIPRAPQFHSSVIGRLSYRQDWPVICQR